jgi:hypothetical protein
MNSMQAFFSNPAPGTGRPVNVSDPFFLQVNEELPTRVFSLPPPMI